MKPVKFYPPTVKALERAAVELCRIPEAQAEVYVIQGLYLAGFLPDDYTVPGKDELLFALKQFSRRTLASKDRPDIAAHQRFWRDGRGHVDYAAYRNHALALLDYVGQLEAALAATSLEDAPV